MKVIIVGDPHFGGSYSYGRTDVHHHVNTRLLDFFNTFDYIIDYIISNDVRAIIITGDIFENRRPQASELSLFSKRIRKLRQLNVDIHIVIGNHDMIREQKTTTLDVLRSLKLKNVYIYPDIKTLSIENEINFIFFPFRTRSMLGCISNDEAIKRFSDRLEYEIGNISNNLPKIVVGHLMIKDTQLGNIVSESSPDEIVLPCEMFSNLDAVVMGHVHPHMVVQLNPLITYIGSMEAKDFHESKVNKYFLVVETNTLSFNFEQLPVRKLYDIVIDQPCKSITEDVITSINEFNEECSLDGSIVRITVAMEANELYYFNKDKVRKFLKKSLNIHHCMGIYPQIVSKRQLRKATITERNDPVTSFNDFLELESDHNMREQMRKIGVQIIRSKK